MIKSSDATIEEIIVVISSNYADTANVAMISTCWNIFAA
jgi:hypothetical protein